MSEIKTAHSLRRAILILDSKQAEDWKNVKIAAEQVHQSVLPINILTNSLKSAITPSEWKDSTLNTLFAMGLSYLAKRTVTGNSHNPIKKIIGSAVQVGLGTLLTQNPAVFDVFHKLWTKFTHKKESAEEAE